MSNGGKVGDEGATVLVIDNGSHTLKAGFVGDNAPKAPFIKLVIIITFTSDTNSCCSFFDFQT